MTTWIDLKNITLSRRPRHKGIHIIRFHLYKVLEKINQIYNTENMSEVPWLLKLG